MRAAFGLASLLVCLGIVIVVMKMGGHPADTINRGKPAREQAERMAGVDHEGMRVQDSIRLEAVEKNGKVNYVMVDDIVADGPMAKYYGLKQNDQIIRVGEIDVRDEDAEMNKNRIYEARTRQNIIRVRRDGQVIDLPQAPDTATPPGQKDPGSPLNRQLEGIKGATRIPTH